MKSEQTKATRKVIVIDEEKCIGCEQCVNACPGGALAMVDGKAKVVRSDYCDGLGACIGECPVDAISFVEEEAACNEPAPIPQPVTLPMHDAPGCNCPSSENQVLKPKSTDAPTDKMPSQLGAWPIQLHLIRPESPQFQGANVLIAASCTAFAHGDFHRELLAGKSLIIACPKLDRLEGYVEKLTALFQLAKPRSVTVARMEVPCCIGLTRLVEEAKQLAGADAPVEEVVVGIRG